MPTGYTYAIKEGISFRDFVLKCARAFEACVSMRDDPMDKEIPEFVASDYYQKELDKSFARLNEIVKMSDADCGIAATQEYEKQVGDRDGCIGDCVDKTVEGILAIKLAVRGERN